MYIFVKKKGGVGYSPLSPIAPRSLILFVVWTADCRSSCFKSFFFSYHTPSSNRSRWFNSFSIRDIHRKCDTHDR